MNTPNHLRLEATWELLRSWCRDGHCRAIAAETGHRDGEVCSFATGKLGASQDAGDVESESIFLIASPTKPFVAVAAMMLVERGELQLDHFVHRYLPRFRGQGKKTVRIAHLLTHTSGLPDMLPNNRTLRKKHAPLAEYMQHVCNLKLLFKPGRRVQYQSMGILTLANVIEEISGQPLPAFLKAEIFDPLQMSHTALGIPDDWGGDGRMQNMAWSQVDDQPHAETWGWNSHYWRKLGAPWGGLLSTASDIGRFCRHLLKIHSGSQSGILSTASLQAMTTNQLRFVEVPARVARSTPWGLGWQLNWPGRPRGFGGLLSPEVYGHWGATGTMVWLDPARGVYGVVLTTEPIATENRRQIAFGNMSSLVW